MHSFILLLFTGIVYVRSQLCLDVAQYDRCSSNSACGCFHMPNTIDTGVCGFLWATCSQLTPCNSPDYTCDAANTVCVQHPRCNNRPVCYPVSMIEQRVCPSTIVNSTTTITSTTTMIPTTFTTTPQLSICVNSTLITFEDLSDLSNIPNGYYGLNWLHAYTLDMNRNPELAGTEFFSSGISGSIVAANSNGSAMIIRIPSPSTFSIKSFVVSAAWNNNVTLSMVSQRGTNYYKEASFNIEKNRYTLIELNWFDINTITFHALNNDNGDKAEFVIDDICIDVTENMNPSSPAPEVIERCPLNELLYENRCHYLDGAGGKCADGYSLGSESLLSRVATQFIGLNYKTRISKNCCIRTSDTSANYGFGTGHCNERGPFKTAPELFNGGCRNSTIIIDGQLTFCVSN